MYKCLHEFSVKTVPDTRVEGVHYDRSVLFVHMTAADSFLTT